VAIFSSFWPKYLPSRLQLYAIYTQITAASSFWIMSIPLFPVLEYVVISYVILPLHCKCQCMPVSAPAAFVQPADTPHQVLTQHVGSVPLSPHPTKGKRLSWPVLCQYRYHALKLSGSRLACSYPQQKARGKNNVRYWRVVHLRVDNASIYSTNVICCFNAIMCSLGCYHKQSWFQKHFFLRFIQ